ncbi:segregation/condensation protein A, partial [Candidatus Sumerlaeota bacterium]|nr:segregation/condensation protein A [Candidatus Sumerlaeota bacterium]
MDEYKVKLQVFEGPLDLLLHLVKINEMDIYDIQIAEVTKQYLEYIRLMQSLDLEVAGEFIVMASTLLNIKLRSLLPDSGEPDEDEEELGDILTAQALMEQLVQYRKFKEAAARLQEQEEQQARIFFRDVALPQFAGIADDGLRGDLDTMLTAFSRVLRFVEARGWHMVTEEEYSVEEKIDFIHRRIQAEKQLDIEGLFRDCRSKV